MQKTRRSLHDRKHLEENFLARAEPLLYHAKSAAQQKTPVRDQIHGPRPRANSPMVASVVTEAEAREIMKAGLGQAELEFLMSLTLPLFWVVREGQGKYIAHNGSAFFLDAGEGPYGVTANHVLEGWKTDKDTGRVVAL